MKRRASANSLGTLYRIFYIHLRGAAHARNLQLAGADLLFGLFDAIGGKERKHGQIQVPLDTAQFNGRETVLLLRNPGSSSIPTRDTPESKMPAESSLWSQPSSFDPRATAPARRLTASSEIDGDYSCLSPSIADILCYSTRQPYEVEPAQSEIKAAIPRTRGPNTASNLNRP